MLSISFLVSTTYQDRMLFIKCILSLSLDCIVFKRDRMLFIRCILSLSPDCIVFKKAWKRDIMRKKGWERSWRMLFIKLFSLQLKTSSGKSSVSVTYFSSSSPVVKNFDCCPGSCFSGVHNIINTFREHTKLFFTIIFFSINLCGLVSAHCYKMVGYECQVSFAGINK